MSAPAASICLDPSWHKPLARQEDEHCWHASFVLLFRRCVNSASSSRKRVGGLLHALFNSEARMAASRVVNRLQLFEAGVKCISGDRDEKLVAEISKVLLQGGKHPMLSVSGRSKRRKLDLETTGSLRAQAGAISSDKNTSASGRFLAHSRELGGEYIHSTERLQDFLEQLPEQRKIHQTLHKPAHLDHAAQMALRQATLPAKQTIPAASPTKPKRLETQPVPAFTQRGCSAGIQLMQSSAQQSFANWLQSDEKQEGQSARKQLWESFCSEQQGCTRKATDSS